MRKNLVLMLALLLLCLGAAGLCEAQDARAVEGAVVIPAADAAFTEGKGVSFENKKAETAYDAEHGMIVNLAKDGEITFTVPEGAEGDFDLYLTVSKMLVQFTSQPLQLQRQRRGALVRAHRLPGQRGFRGQVQR